MKIVRTILTLIAIFYAIMAVISGGMMSGKGLADAIVKTFVYLSLATCAGWLEAAEEDRQKELELLTEIRDMLKLKELNEKKPE